MQHRAESAAAAAPAAPAATAPKDDAAVPAVAKKKTKTKPQFSTAVMTKENKTRMFAIRMTQTRTPTIRARTPTVRAISRSIRSLAEIRRLVPSTSWMLT